MRPRPSAIRILLVLVAALLFLFLLTPTGRYLLRAGSEEGRILRARRPIAMLVTDPAVPAAERAKLRIVLDARRFARDSVGLRVGESFTTYTHLTRDTLVLVLSGAYRDRLASYGWWFPIVGRVPYKGFFDFAAARRAAAALAAEGLDVNLRPASAFSTLGWFNDPLVSTTLRADSLELANTVIHEVTHNTFYAPGQAVFNESFANFVGARGAAWFYRSRGDSAAAAIIDQRWQDEKTLGAFWTAEYHTLDSAYRAHPGDSAREARLAARDAVWARARERLERDVAPRLLTIPPAAAARMRLDNAALLARRIYLTDLPLFDEVWIREQGDLRRTVQQVITLAKSRPKAPYTAVREWLGGPAADPAERDTTASR